MREKAKALSTLLSSPGKLAQQRKTRAQMHDRIGDSFSHTSIHGQNEIPYESSSVRSPRTFEEDREMNEALEQSKRAYEAEERKRKAKEESDFQSALAASQRQSPLSHNQRQQPVETE